MTAIVECSLLDSDISKQQLEQVVSAFGVNDNIDTASSYKLL